VIQEAWVGGVSTRRVDDLVQAMGLAGISKSTVSKLCKALDERVGAFLDRPLVEEWPSLAGCDLSQAARRRAHRLGSGDTRCGRERRGQAGERGLAQWPRRSGDLLGQLPQEHAASRPARREAGHLGLTRFGGHLST
jgi:hypothetical protein